MEELMQGQKKLIRKLYQPEAFGERLLGNFSRFRDVRFRPEALNKANLVTLARLGRFYSTQSGQARSFFWRALWNPACSLRQDAPFPLRPAAASKKSLIHADCDPHALDRDRRHHCDLQSRECSFAQAPSVPTLRRIDVDRI